MTHRRPAHQTQWAAQFAVASELCKRGYEVTFTTGNHPSIDLMAYSPKQVPFAVDVKGLYKKNFWPVREKLARKDLFYVLAFVPDDRPNRFFVLTQKQVNKGIRDNFLHVQNRAKAKDKVLAHNPFPGVEWKFVERFESAWDSLPK